MRVKGYYAAGTTVLSGGIPRRLNHSTMPDMHTIEDSQSEMQWLRALLQGLSGSGAKHSYTISIDY
jgi:hypothetical protein